MVESREKHRVVIVGAGFAGFNHIICQLELASVAADPEERRSRCTFVVVGAGYTGTEVTAQGQLLDVDKPRA